MFDGGGVLSKIPWQLIEESPQKPNVAAISRHMATQVATLANGVKHMGNGVANGAVANGSLPNGVAGKVAPAINQVQAKFGALVQENRDALRGGYQYARNEANNFHMDGHI